MRRRPGVVHDVAGPVVWWFLWPIGHASASTAALARHGTSISLSAKVFQPPNHLLKQTPLLTSRWAHSCSWPLVPVTVLCPCLFLVHGVGWALSRRRPSSWPNGQTSCRVQDTQWAAQLGTIVCVASERASKQAARAHTHQHYLIAYRFGFGFERYSDARPMSGRSPLLHALPAPWLAPRMLHAPRSRSMPIDPILHPGPFHYDFVTYIIRRAPPKTFSCLAQPGPETFIFCPVASSYLSYLAWLFVFHLVQYHNFSPPSYPWLLPTRTIQPTHSANPLSPPSLHTLHISYLVTEILLQTLY
ncbi:hypothetical protein LZ32DRAFT_123349 [Colletotrichum eremochloae]|nr:hypothetical protein LZ32DRAFT_123349 [Colletotrichum eremochloae]